HREGVERFDLAVFLVQKDLGHLGNGNAVVDGDVNGMLLDLKLTAEAVVGDQQPGGEQPAGRDQCEKKNQEQAEGRTWLWPGHRKLLSCRAGTHELSYTNLASANIMASGVSRKRKNEKMEIACERRCDETKLPNPMCQFLISKLSRLNLRDT